MATGNKCMVVSYVYCFNKKYKSGTTITAYNPYRLFDEYHGFTPLW